MGSALGQLNESYDLGSISLGLIQRWLRCAQVWRESGDWNVAMTVYGYARVSTEGTNVHRPRKRACRSWHG
jgi:hypothetical protein